MSTALIRRQPRRGRWSIAIAVALGLNALLISLLARTAPDAAPPALPPSRPLQLATVPPVSRPVPQSLGSGAPQAAARTSQQRPAALAELPLPELPSLAAISPPRGEGWLAGVATATTGAPEGSGAIGTGYEPPHALTAFDLERYYPWQAQRRGLSATVTVRIDIAADGSVAGAEVVGNDGSPDFADASLRVVRAVGWSPARSDGVPVASQHRISIVWTLRR